MNSLDIIKQELINQKNALEQRGFAVTTAHTNPSPTEITNAINNINVDFSQADVEPEDVAQGKTYYGRGGTLQTGTFDKDRAEMLSGIALGSITNTGRYEIYIPEDTQYNQVRPYAYYCGTSTNADALFYKHNLIIPPHITEIGARCFCGANVTGKLILPATCTKVGNFAFQSTGITEAEIYVQNLDSATYIFSSCKSLIKVIVGESITKIPNAAFSYCSVLEEIYFPSTLASLANQALTQCESLKLVKFTSNTPPTTLTGSFSSIGNAVFLVPYAVYDTYLNATNYQKYPRDQYGFGEFNTNDALPDSITGYTITWHATLDDAKSNINPITTCPTAGTYYARYTATA